jgi:mono/diheme cytochrome c family protein
MKLQRKNRPALLAAAALGILIAGTAVRLPGQSSKEEAAAKNIIHGKYLVDNAVLCVDCHTPFNAKGEPDRGRWLQGTTLGFAPLQPVPNWATVAPPIAGLPGWTDAAAVNFLVTGLDSSGKPARPPMPQFRFSRSDAVAIVAYLKSLKPAN